MSCRLWGVSEESPGRGRWECGLPQDGPCSATQGWICQIAGQAGTLSGNAHKQPLLRVREQARGQLSAQLAFVSV